MDDDVLRYEARERKLHPTKDDDELPLLQYQDVDEAEFYDDPKNDNLFKETPWKAIALTVFLFLIGSIMLSLGILIKTGVIKTQYEDRGLPLIILGSICFIPGSFYVVVIIQVCRGVPGWSFDEFPEM